MTAGHAKKLVEVDQIAFRREEARSQENLEALWLSDPEGCFVLLDGDSVVGYSYCKTMGSEGYLGPVGLLPEFQDSGYGKNLITRSLDYLKLHCIVIGLEVYPELGDNLGIYYKMGFTSGFPSILFRFPGELSVQRKFQIKSLFEVSKRNQTEILQKIDSWTRNSFDGVSYLKDLRGTLDLNGLILVAFNDNEPIGFLAYKKTLLPYLWGITKPGKAQKKIIRELMAIFMQLNPACDVIVQVNSRYTNFIDLLFEMNFNVHRSVNRMLLRGYEGNHFNKSKKNGF